MANIRGFEILEDRLYLVDRHVWAQPMAGGVVRLGLTPVAYHLLRHSLESISVRHSVLGRGVQAGASVAMVESAKYVGPLAAPFAGTVLRANEAVLADAALAEADPYGAGWIAEMAPADWAEAQAGLLTGDAALAAYEQLLRSQNIRAE